MAQRKTKLWAGRFSESTSKILEEFTESISFDKRLAIYDIKASIAHTLMLKKVKIITNLETEKIINGLSKILSLVKSGKFRFDKYYEDVHLNIENYLIKLIGNVGKKLHTARSRNDQIIVDMMLYLKDEIKEIIELINKLQSTIVSIAEKSLNIIIPGYTHLKQAQPVLLSSYLMAYFYKFQRDKEKFKNNLKSVDTLPLGVGAVAGVNYPIDRNYVAKLLGFSRISENSIDTVSQRDYIIEFIFCCAITAMHLSRLAEDLIIWNTDEFGFIEINDTFATGSSIMPNKKNPDVLELIRGKTAKIYGNLMSILTLLKALPLSYNRDLQEDKKMLFETADYIKPMLNIMSAILDNITFKESKIKEKMKDGFILAVDIADYLVKRGLPFRKAHNIVGKIVKYCIDNNKLLFELSLKEFRKFSKAFGNDILQILDYKKSIESKISDGGTSIKQVKKQILNAKKVLQ